jgi:uncharacterized protein (DUF849 family)
MVSRLFVAALNGGRGRAEHPGVPIAASELGSDAAKVARLGANEVHIHPRRTDEQESLAPDDVASAVHMIRRYASGVRISVTTGGWIEPDPIRRRDQVSDWTAVPDSATVNVHEDGALEVARALNRRGVAVEAGLFTVTSAERWVNGPMRELTSRVLIEPVERPTLLALHDAETILAILDRYGVDQPRLLHGDGENAWPVLAMAIRLGIPSRVGFEDTLYLPDGTPAPDNASLVRTAFSGQQDIRSAR